MKTQSHDKTLLITDFTELGGANAVWFRDLARGSLTPAHMTLDVDLSRVRFIDSDGIGALVSVCKTLRERGGQVRLLKPAAQVCELFHMLKLDEVFEMADH